MYVYSEWWEIKIDMEPGVKKMTKYELKMCS